MSDANTDRPALSPPAEGEFDRRFSDPKSQAVYDLFRRDGWMRGDIDRFYVQGFNSIGKPEAGTPRGAVWWAGKDRALAGLPSLIPDDRAPSLATPTPAPADHIGDATEKMPVDWERVGPKLVEALERIAHPQYGLGFNKLRGIARAALAAAKPDVGA